MDATLLTGLLRRATPWLTVVEVLRLAFDVLSNARHEQSSDTLRAQLELQGVPSQVIEPMTRAIEAIQRIPLDKRDVIMRAFQTRLVRDTYRNTAYDKQAGFDSALSAALLRFIPSLIATLATDVQRTYYSFTTAERNTLVTLVTRAFSQLWNRLAYADQVKIGDRLGLNRKYFTEPTGKGRTTSSGSQSAGTAGTKSAGPAPTTPIFPSSQSPQPSIQPATPKDPTTKSPPPPTVIETGPPVTRKPSSGGTGAGPDTTNKGTAGTGGSGTGGGGSGTGSGGGSSGSAPSAPGASSNPRTPAAPKEPDYPPYTGKEQEDDGDWSPIIPTLSSNDLLPSDKIVGDDGLFLLVQGADGELFVVENLGGRYEYSEEHGGYLDTYAEPETRIEGPTMEEEPETGIETVGAGPEEEDLSQGADLTEEARPEEEDYTVGSDYVPQEQEEPSAEGEEFFEPVYAAVDDPSTYGEPENAYDPYPAEGFSFEAPPPFEEFDPESAFDPALSEGPAEEIYEPSGYVEEAGDDPYSIPTEYSPADPGSELFSDAAPEDEEEFWFEESYAEAFDRVPRFRVARVTHDKRCVCDRCRVVRDAFYRDVRASGEQPIYRSSWLDVSEVDLGDGVYGETDLDTRPFEVRINPNQVLPRKQVALAHEGVHVMSELLKIPMTHDQVHSAAVFLSGDVVPAIQSLT